MKKTSVEQCVCGKRPKAELDVSYTGGSRYKAATRTEGWDVICPSNKCYHRTIKYHDTETGAVAEWNAEVTRLRARRDAKDKLLHDLDHVGYPHSSHEQRVEEALARLIRAAEAGSE